MTQTRIFKIDILLIYTADDRIVAAFKREPIDDNRYFFLVDLFIDVFQIRKILYFGMESKLPGSPHQTFCLNTAGFGTTGYPNHLFFP